MTEALIRELIETPVGDMTLITDKAGTVRMLEFTDHRNRQESHATRHFNDVEIRDGKTSGPARKAVEAYYDGHISAINELITQADGTDFQNMVWTALRTIPAGETWSYGDLAKAVGNPKAFRAAGSANGANPIAIIVPCHRVIASGGKLGGYGGGLDRKRWLLAHEATHADDGLL